MAIQERLIAEKVAIVSVVGWVLLMILLAVVVALIVDGQRRSRLRPPMKIQIFRAEGRALTPEGDVHSHAHFRADPAYFRIFISRQDTIVFVSKTNNN
jgi:hypothetical protein